MSQQSSEHLNRQDGPTLSDTSGEESEGVGRGYDSVFDALCDVKVEALRQKMAALRAAGHTELDALKRQWEARCDDLHGLLEARLGAQYQAAQEKAAAVRAGKERLEAAKRQVAQLNLAMAGLPALEAAAQ